MLSTYQLRTNTKDEKKYLTEPKYPNSKSISRVSSAPLDDEIVSEQHLAAFVYVNESYQLRTIRSARAWLKVSGKLGKL